MQTDETRAREVLAKVHQMPPTTSRTIFYPEETVIAAMLAYAKSTDGDTIAREVVPEFFYPLSDDHPSKLEGEHVWLWHPLWGHARLGWYDNEAQWWKIGFPDGEWWGVGIPPSHVARVTPREYVNREREVTLLLAQIYRHRAAFATLPPATEKAER